MLVLKMMTGTAMPDDDAAHDFVLIQLGDKDRLSFERRPVASNSQVPDTVDVYAVIVGDDGYHEYLLEGNAYVMNAQGKTIASRASY